MKKENVKDMKGKFKKKRNGQQRAREGEEETGRERTERERESIEIQYLINKNHVTLYYRSCLASLLVTRRIRLK